MSKVSASSRVARLLAMAPWVTAQGGASMSELCDRFAVTKQQLESDLQVLGMVGVAPHTADMLIEVTIDDDWVTIRSQGWMDRPPALTAAQGLALLAAAEALMEVQGADADGPLARALAKVEAAMGVEVGRELDVDLGHASDDVMEQVTQAARERTQLDVRYYGHGADRITERTIEPWRVFASAGAWYVNAWCHRANELRLFRLDRFEAVTSTGVPATVERHDIPDPGPNPYIPQDDDVEVTLVIDAAVAWAVERWNTNAIEVLPDGARRVTLSVGSMAWLERVLIQLGPRATVDEISDPDALDRSAMIRRILKRYHR
jgi:proteasome accessory factor C